MITVSVGAKPSDVERRHVVQEALAVTRFTVFTAQYVRAPAVHDARGRQFTYTAL